MSFESLDGMFPKSVAQAVAAGEPIKILESAPEAAPVDPAPVVSDPPEPKASPLAERIRADREARQARTRDQAEVSDVRKQLDEARAQIEAFKAQSGPVHDPIAWAKMQNMTRDEQALFGQALLYDLVPDKAPADQRIRLFEMKQAREARTREAADTERRNAEQAQHTQRMIANYAADIESTVETFTAGSFPDSEDWFGDDTGSYVQSLMATARNLADAANKAGQRADVSPQAVAKALEAEVAKRMKIRDERAAKRKPAMAPVEALPGVGKLTDNKGTGETISTKGLGGAGAPRPPAMTETERIARAAEVVFGAR